MKIYRRDIRFGLMASIFFSVFVIIATPMLSTQLLSWFNKTNKNIIENSNMANSICSRHYKVLYGIFSMPHKIETRAIVRQKTQCGFNNEIHRVVFVVGMPKKDSDYDIIARESRTYHDIFVLSCEENMNSGKSYTFFKEALEQLPCFDFYAKVDDDTAFNPGKLSNKITGIQNNALLYIGRNTKNLDRNFLMYIVKSIHFLFRDMSWIYQVDRYNAGMLYILNSQAVGAWVASNPVDLYGDEDYRTSYYMTQLNARVVNLDEMFHDYFKYKTYQFQNHWRLDITNNSLAVHQCKSERDLFDAFNSICAV
jgi:hypothetical protein